MSKFTKDNVPQLAKSYYGEKQARFIDAANAAYDVTEDEPTAILAGMIAAGEDRNAYSRALVLKLKDQYEQAKLISAEFAKNNTLDAEIFAAGQWNKVWKFTVGDLDQIIATFNELAPHGFKVPLKFGHNDKQPVTDGQPALGWVTHVWRKGEKLMGRFEHVPDVVRAAIESKLYRHVSVELDIDVKDHVGKKHKYVLSAVALLGADRPAVSTLAELGKLATSDDGHDARFTVGRRELFSTINGSRTEVEMTEAEVQAAIDKSMRPLNEQIAALTKENETLKATNAQFKASAEAGEVEAKKAKVKAHREALTAKFETAVKAQQITPAQREMGLKFMRIDQDDSVLSVTPESVDDYIKVNGGKAKMSTESGRGAGNGASGEENEVEDPGAEIVRLAQEKQLENPKLSFAQARDSVFAAHPELAKQWMGVVQE